MADDRIEAIEPADLPQRLTAAEASGRPLVVAGAGAVPHRTALAWLLHAVEATGAWGAIADAVADTGGGTVAPVLRSPPDPHGLRHGAPLDAGTLLIEPPYAATTLLGEGATSALAARRLLEDPRLAHVPYPLFAAPARADGAATARVATMAAAEGRIAVIVPTRDNGEDVERFVQSLRAHAERPDALDIVVIDNGSREPGTLAVLDRLSADGRIEVLRLDVAFNWSWLNNEAVRRTSAPILLFANDDMVMLSGGWDTEIRRLLGDPAVGAVGAHLLYDDGTLQHAGVLLGWKRSVIHDGLDDPADSPGPDGRRRHRRSAAAATGAFLATRRGDFERLGGFDDRLLPIAYSDIDYCLKARRDGLAILVTPEIRLFHHESKSRGLDHKAPERQARNAEEQAVMARRWGDVLATDVTMNPHWVQDTRPFRLIRWPSPERVAEYIRATGEGRTWVRPLERPSEDEMPRLPG